MNTRRAPPRQQAVNRRGVRIEWLNAWLRSVNDNMVGLVYSKTRAKSTPQVGE